MLFEAGLLLTKPDAEAPVSLGFDGMLHEARFDCDYLSSDHKRGYTVTISRTHADGTVRLAREIPYGSPGWKRRYHRHNSAESRNSVLERLSMKRLPVHGLSRAHVTVLRGDFVVKKRTLVRLVRELTAHGWRCLVGGASGRDPLRLPQARPTPRFGLKNHAVGSSICIGLSTCWAGWSPERLSFPFNPAH